MNVLARSVRTALALLVPLLLAALPWPVAPAAAGLPQADDPVGVWPLSPTPDVVDRFDPPDDPWGSGHRGVDLAGRAGQLVRTALPGRVAYVGRIAGRGVVTVAHRGAAGGTRTTYEPVAATVPVGDRVAPGDVLGRLQLVGSHCFPAACLHWGWLRGTTYLDPLRLVGGGPVRLLPLWQDVPVTGTGWSPPAHLRHARGCAC